MADAAPYLVPDSLVELYNDTLLGTAAVCHWVEVGPKNSRWINDQAERSVSLGDILRRIADLEQALGSILKYSAPSNGAAAMLIYRKSILEIARHALHGDVHTVQAPSRFGCASAGFPASGTFKRA